MLAANFCSHAASRRVTCMHSCWIGSVKLNAACRERMRQPDAAEYAACILTHPVPHAANISSTVQRSCSTVKHAFSAHGMAFATRLSVWWLLLAAAAAAAGGGSAARHPRPPDLILRLHSVVASKGDQTAPIGDTSVFMCVVCAASAG